MRKIFLTVLIAVPLLSAGLYHFVTTDYSLRQNEHRRKLGAVYMTLNNPFYEVIDEEIRTAVENHGDILISRDPALSVDRQVEEIQNLIDAGVELIFINPVDWTKIEPALELARAAQIPVIAIDTNVEDDSLVACTVVSDNYAAGLRCSSIRRRVRRLTGFKASATKFPPTKILRSSRRRNVSVSLNSQCPQWSK